MKMNDSSSSLSTYMVCGKLVTTIVARESGADCPPVIMLA